MKSKILAIFFILISISSKAQIQRHFWGLELGESTKSEVRDFMNRNNLIPSKVNGGYDCFIILDEKVSLGGYSWSPTFEFYSNKLFSIELCLTHLEVDDQIGIVDNSSINTSLFYELKKRIGAKYENVEVIISPQNPKYQYILRDNNTVLVLELDDKKNLFLEYYDRKLGRQQRDAGDF